MRPQRLLYSFFFFNDTATTEIYTLSLHDALPIFAQCGKTGVHLRADRARPRPCGGGRRPHAGMTLRQGFRDRERIPQDRKSTRLNSSHSQNSYAVFCLKKKKKQNYEHSLGSKSKT